LARRPSSGNAVTSISQFCLCNPAVPSSAAFSLLSASYFDSRPHSLLAWLASGSPARLDNTISSFSPAFGGHRRTAPTALEASCGFEVDCCCNQTQKWKELPGNAYAGGAVGVSLGAHFQLHCSALLWKVLKEFWL